MKRLLSLAVVCTALLGAVLLFATTQQQDQGQTLQFFSMLSDAQGEAIESTSDNGLPNLFLQLAAVNNSEVAIAVLDNDLNNGGIDGNYDYDSIIRSLAGSGVVLVVLSIAVVLRAVGDSRLLLSPCEPPILSSVWLLGLERPG